MMTLGEGQASRARIAGSRAVRRIRLAVLLLAPSLFCLALFTYGPVLVVAVQSLMQTRRGEAGWGLGNYARLLADTHFRTALGNNAVYALGTIAPSLLLALAFALALHKNSRVTTVLRTERLRATGGWLFFYYTTAEGAVRVIDAKPHITAAYLELLLIRTKVVDIVLAYDIDNTVFRSVDMSPGLRSRVLHAAVLDPAEFLHRVALARRHVITRRFPLRKRLH